MKPLALTVVWLALLGSSILSYFLADGRLTGKLLVVVVLSVALAKLVMVAASFMELWGRPYLFVAVGLFASTLAGIALAW